MVTLKQEPHTGGIENNYPQARFVVDYIGGAVNHPTPTRTNHTTPNDTELVFKEIEHPPPLIHNTKNSKVVEYRWYRMSFCLRTYKHP